MQFNATHDFTIDANLLVSVIKSKAGILNKVILKGVMNSIYAGATRVDITFTVDTLTLQNSGRGFPNEDEIKNWFGRFGTPHKAGSGSNPSQRLAVSRSE